MISTSIEFLVGGSSYEEIIQKVKEFISNLLEITEEDVEKKTNIEIHISDSIDSFDEDDYTARVVAKVRNV